MERTIAKKLRFSGDYEGIPKVVIEAIVRETLSWLSTHVYDDTEVGVLDELECCEACEMWCHPERMHAVLESDSEETLHFCAACGVNGLPEKEATK